MLSFRHFLSQDNGVKIPVVSVPGIAEKFDEINEQFDFHLNEGLSNPYTGWLWSSKILESYGIELPKVIFTDKHEDTEIVALNINESDEYYFYYEYKLMDEGYQSFASIVTESELEELLADE